MKVLVTCPPMQRVIDEFRPLFERHGLTVDAPEVVQTLPETELVRLVPLYEGWIIGDDPATRTVFAAGKRGKLRAAVKWGVGVDNVDFVAAREFGVPVTNTPQMFGNEVADVAMCYVTGLARELFQIDRAVRAGGWPKPAGVSLSGKTVAVVGCGDVGLHLTRRLLAAEMHVIVYDPTLADAPPEVALVPWPERLQEAHFLVFTCPLTRESRHMLNAGTLARAKRGVRIVNVARGPLIDEAALVDALVSGHVAGVALDVFEAEPLPLDAPLRGFPQCVLGSHNSSNTAEAVRRTSALAIEKLLGFLDRGHR